jgi:hypothetical protein
MKTPDIMGRQHEGYTEDLKMWGETATAPAFPLDII